MSLTIFELDALFQNPQQTVPAVARLGGGTIQRDAMGHPIRSSGRHTVVYELRETSGRILVLRVHQHLDGERDRVLAQRYSALRHDHHLDELRASNGPLPGNIQWLADGLDARDAHGEQDRRPLVAMERVPGRTLREMVARLAREEDAAHLALLADSWLDTALAMENAGFVHGDLGPDNIMVRPDGSIAVIDLDTATWPGFHLERDVRGGSSALRHPMGPPHNPAYRDRFPVLMVWAALRLLAIRPGLLHGSPAEGLLFSSAELRRSASPTVFSRLDETDASLRLLLEVVRRAVRFSPEELPPLSEIASRLDSLGFPRRAPHHAHWPAPPGRATGSATRSAPPGAVASDPGHRTSSVSTTGRQTPSQSATEESRAFQADHLETLHTAIQQRNAQEALRIWAEVREDPSARIYATVIHQIVEQDARTAIDRALRRRDDAALLLAVEQAERAGVAPDSTALSAAREARRRTETRSTLAIALRDNDWQALLNLHRSGQLDECGPLDPVARRAVARALAWPAVERALASNDDVAICAAADAALWREDETQPHEVWERLDLAWQRSHWTRDVRAALRRRDAPYLRGLLAKPPPGAEERLTQVERRRVHRVIAREQAATRLEVALREGPDREVVEALAELELSGAPFSDGLDWSAVRGVVDRLSLADALRAAMATEPPDTARLARLLPAARAALGDLQHAGTEWAELEQAVLRAAHLERLREALDSGDDARIAAAADPDPFQVRALLADEEAVHVAAVLGRTRTQVRRHAS